MSMRGRRRTYKENIKRKKKKKGKEKKDAAATVLDNNARALAIFSPFHLFTFSPLYVPICPFTFLLFHLQVAYKS